MLKFNQFQNKFNEVPDLTGVKSIEEVSRDEFIKICCDYVQDKNINESIDATRYSVEVNYRTNKKQAALGFAKIALGYVSSALKSLQYHCKTIFDDSPYRVLISSRNWDDGEWVVMISYNEKFDFFVLSKGYYNKMKKTITTVAHEKMQGEESAAVMAKAAKDAVDELRYKKPKDNSLNNFIYLKRGPKK